MCLTQSQQCVCVCVVWFFLFLLLSVVRNISRDFCYRMFFPRKPRMCVEGEGLGIDGPIDASEQGAYPSHNHRFEGYARKLIELNCSTILWPHIFSPNCHHKIVLNLLFYFVLNLIIQDCYYYYFFFHCYIVTRHWGNYKSEGSLVGDDLIVIHRACPVMGSQGTFVHAVEIPWE